MFPVVGQIETLLKTATNCAEETGLVKNASAPRDMARAFVFAFPSALTTMMGMWVVSDELFKRRKASKPVPPGMDTSMMMADTDPLLTNIVACMLSKAAIVSYPAEFSWVHV